MRALIMLAIAVSIASPARALNVLVNDHVYDVKALSKIEHLKDKTALYHYSLNGSDKELILKTPIEVPDLRPLKEKKPKVYWGRVIWRWMCRAATGANIFGAFKGVF